jgi:hypothetical protein
VIAPSLGETLKIARSLTHSGFTQAKADQVVAGIEQAIANNEGRHVSPSGEPGPYSDMGGQRTEYTIELKGPVDLELFDPNVAHDEIDEDPAEPHIISAPGGVLFSDGSVVEPDGDEDDRDSVRPEG